MVFWTVPKNGLWSFGLYYDQTLWPKGILKKIQIVYQKRKIPVYVNVDQQISGCAYKIVYGKIL